MRENFDEDARLLVAGNLPNSAPLSGSRHNRPFIFSPLAALRGPRQDSYDDQFPEEDSPLSEKAYPSLYSPELDSPGAAKTEISWAYERISSAASPDFPYEKNPRRSSQVPPLARRILCALPAFASGFSWSTLCIYFLCWYLALPRLPDGKIPRIGGHYGLWPYISCIGAVHEVIFKTASLFTAICIMLAFSIDYYYGKDIAPGIWWRRGKTCFGYLTSIFLIALSFVSINGHHNPGEPDKHMIFASIHIATAICAKFCDFMLGYNLRKVNRTNRILIIAKRWKKLVGLIAGPCAIITMIGIYGCDNDPKIAVPGSKCYKISSVAAVAEWIVAAAFVNYLFALSFTTYHAEAIRLDMLIAVENVRLAQSRGTVTVKPFRTRTQKILLAIKHFFW